MKKFKKRLFGIITFMMLALAVPVVFPGSYGVKEVQAAVKVTAPKLLSAKPYGTNKINAEKDGFSNQNPRTPCKDRPHDGL